MKMKMKRTEIFLELCGDFVPGEMFDWLMENGFFTAPASSRYHGNHQGGLFDHSLEVTNKLVSMTEEMQLQWSRPESPIIVGMFHDLCKIDEYRFTEFCIEHSDRSLLKGHGDKSVMLLSLFMTLTEEEMLCIRFHMGAYQTDDWDAYGRAIEKYQNVLWTHAADMFAARVRGT